MIEDDKVVLDILPASYIGGVMAQIADKPWLLLVGPPGCGKTEMVLPYQDCEEVMFRDDMTMNALFSGYTDENKSDPSLAKSLDLRCLICKDFASLRAKNPEKAIVIMSQFRGAYDGHFDLHSGTAGHRGYVTRIGVILCTTPFPVQLSLIFQQMGERFLSVRMSRVPVTPQRAVERSLESLECSRNKAAVRDVLRKEFKGWMKEALLFSMANYEAFTMPRREKQRLAELGYLVTRIRTAPIKNEGADGNLETSERVVSQLQSLGTCHALADGRTEWGEEETALILRVAHDTIPAPMRRIFNAVYQMNNIHNKNATVQEIWTMTKKRFSTDFIADALRQFAEVELVNTDDNVSEFWLTDFTFHILEASGFFLATTKPNLLRRQIHEETNYGEDKLNLITGEDGTLYKASPAPKPKPKTSGPTTLPTIKPTNKPTKSAPGTGLPTHPPA